MPVPFIHWNCRGLIHNIDDIHKLIDEYEPQVVALQETNLTKKHDKILRSYHLLRKDREESTRASGGVALVVAQGTILKSIQLDTTLEAVAAQVYVNKLITVVSLYLPPSDNVSLQELNDLVEQLPAPFVIMGDFNAHHCLWGGDKIDSRGKQIEQWLTNNSLLCSIMETRHIFLRVRETFLR